LNSGADPRQVVHREFPQSPEAAHLMAQRDDNVSHGGLLVEDRLAHRPARTAPQTDRWWLVDAPVRPSRSRSGRGPAHHPSRPQTHSDGLPLGHLFDAVTPAAGLSMAEAAQLIRGERPVRPVVHGPGHGRAGQADVARPGRTPLPRRRDLRNARAAAPVAWTPPPAPSVSSTPPGGIALGLGAEPLTPGTGLPLPGPATAPATGTVPLVDLGEQALPRRRDLRRAEQATQSRRALRESRKGALAEAARSARTTTTVARGAVLTGLVAVGVVTISGQQLDIARLSPSAPDTTAELALAPDPFQGVVLTGEASHWDAGPEVDVAVQAGIRDMEARLAAERRAAAKRAAEKAAAEARAAAKAKALRDAQRDPRAIGKIMAAERGWTGSQWTCLNSLWIRESNWRWNADNPTSSAYGIPQALPGSKMASAGSDWATNPVTQIEWGLDYIADRYGSPCNAWAHSESVGWY
jgi:hypothetical protein